MQDRYAGDVGDFGKFALLRHLFVNTDYRLGIVWYQFPNEIHNNDGKHVNYLLESKFQQVDQYLCAILTNIVEGERSTQALSESRLLPICTVYYSEPLDFHHKNPTQTTDDKKSREAGRLNWHKKAMESVSSCNVIFIDPDNGLQINSCPKLSNLKSGKFAYYDEVRAYMEHSDICVIYHHLNRHKNHGTHQQQIESRSKELKERTGNTNHVFALRFKPYSPRAYFILTKPSSNNYVRERLKDIMDSPHGSFWDTYFEL